MSENGARKVPSHWDELFPGRFLKAGQFQRPVTLRISAVYTEPLPQETGGTKVRGILSFERTDSEMPINKTNGILLRALWGEKVQDWVGKRATFGMVDTPMGPGIQLAGSPDLSEPVQVEVKLARRRPKTITLRPTEEVQ
jgi:hypothetical protein